MSGTTIIGALRVGAWLETLSGLGDGGGRHRDL
jgi:hypothetical protein